MYAEMGAAQPGNPLCLRAAEIDDDEEDAL
jgi:hypothetical protein